MIKVGDKVRDKHGRFCGMDGLVNFWGYRGIVDDIWQVEGHDGSNFIGAHGPLTRVRVLRNLKDETSWFCCNIEDLELDM